MEEVKVRIRVRVGLVVMVRVVGGRTLLAAVST